MSALDEVLEAYRDMFGVKTERANETHHLACEEVAHLRMGRSGMGTLQDKVIKELGYSMGIPNESDIAFVALWVSRRTNGGLTSTICNIEEEPLTDELRERIVTVLHNLAETVCPTSRAPDSPSAGCVCVKKDLRKHN